MNTGLGTNMVLHQFDYILAIGFIFAFLDAWGIGANDVANSYGLLSILSRKRTGYAAC